MTAKKYDLVHQKIFWIRRQKPFGSHSAKYYLRLENVIQPSRNLCFQINEIELTCFCPDCLRVVKGSGEMDQWLRELSALLEDLSSDPSTDRGWSTIVCNSRFRGFDTFWPIWVLTCIWYTHRDIHINKNHYFKNDMLKMKSWNFQVNRCKWKISWVTYPRSRKTSVAFFSLFVVPSSESLDLSIQHEVTE